MSKNIDSPNPVEAGAATDPPIPSVPLANVSTSRIHQATDVTGKYFWLLSILCLIVALGLVWWSLPERGVAIEINFHEGHGLEAEDSVRFKGIEVGVVEEVKLNRDLTGVDVRVNLKPFAASLAREGTRFWIVRPQLSLTGISGLETAVGHKYIGLIPGDPAAPRVHSFDGLTASPADAFAHDGMEITLRSEKKYSVSAGSPVTCRGVEIGRILSVGLSQDGRFVDVRARVFEKFTKLVSTKSKFWATSGVDVDFSFTDGVKINMESLETIARGGVSMLTTEKGGQPIKPGDVFSLSQKPGEDWYQAANLVPATDVELRGVTPLIVQWKYKGIVGTSSKTEVGNGILLGGDSRSRNGKSTLLVPTDLLAERNKMVSSSMKISLGGDAAESAPVAEVSVSATSRIQRIEIPSNQSLTFFTPSEIRPLAALETCLAVRASGDFENLTFLHYPIEVVDLEVNEAGWLVSNFDGSRDVWHGCPILAASDGKLIGVLLIEKRQTLIVPVQP